MRRGRSHSEKKKTKKQREEPQDEVAQSESAALKDSEKKKKKRKKQKEAEQVPEAVGNESVDNDGDVEILDISEPQEEIDQPDPANSNEPEKKRKKKKKSKETEQISDPMSNGTAADENIGLPDAPAEHAPQASISPSPDEAAPETAAEDSLQIEEKSLGVNLLDSPDPSCFYSTRMSLCLSIPAITLPKHAKRAILSLHLAPLLLTYFAPARGVVLAFDNPVLSAKSNSAINLPLRQPTGDETEAQDDEGTIKEILAQTSDQFGAAWVWLTVTFLVFRPQRGDGLYGWNNVASEGFVGLVSYNYFQTAVGASRIPSEWKWMGPAGEQRKRKKGRKEKMLEDGRRSQSSPAPSSSIVADEHTREEIEDQTGFMLRSGEKVNETMKYRVIDTEMVPGGEKGKWALHIDASLLDEQGEKRLADEEKGMWERRHNRQSGTPGLEMSGGLGLSREGSAVSVASSSGPAVRHRVAY